MTTKNSYTVLMFFLIGAGISILNLWNNSEIIKRNYYNFYLKKSLSQMINKKLWNKSILSKDFHILALLHYSSVIFHHKIIKRKHLNNSYCFNKKNLEKNIAKYKTENSHPKWWQGTEQLTRTMIAMQLIIRLVSHRSQQPLGLFSWALALQCWP